VCKSKVSKQPLHLLHHIHNWNLQFQSNFIANVFVNLIIIWNSHFFQAQQDHTCKWRAIVEKHVYTCTCITAAIDKSIKKCTDGPESNALFTAAMTSVPNTYLYSAERGIDIYMKTCTHAYLLMSSFMKTTQTMQMKYYIFISNSDHKINLKALWLLRPMRRTHYLIPTHTWFSKRATFNFFLFSCFTA